MFIYKAVHRISDFDYRSLKSGLINPRKLLLANNFIMALCAIALFGFALLVCVAFYQSSANGSTRAQTDRVNSIFNWIGLAIAGLLLIVLCIIGMRGAHLVSLELLLFYFWGISFFISPLILGTIICFDFYVYLSTWFTHHWETSEFYQVRKYFCPEGTADNKCIAPILGGPGFSTTLEWCKSLYNSTDCSIIREKALSAALEFGRRTVVIEGAVCVLNCVQIFCSIYLCFVILTVPVITQSMNDKINFLLVQPLAACAVVASVLWILRDLDVSFKFIPSCFLAVTIIQGVQIPVGILGGRWKSHATLTGSIVLLSCTLALLAACGISCLVFSVFVSDVLLIDTTRTQADDIACAFQLQGCCCCELGAGMARCPEWSKEEIMAQLATILKICGIVSFLCMLYIGGAVIVSAVTRTNLKNYKSDYI